MNAIYKLIFNVSTGMWVVAHERAASRGGKRRTPLVGAVAAALALVTGAAVAADGPESAKGAVQTAAGDLVEYDASTQTITVGAGIDGNVVEFRDQGGNSRTLAGVRAGSTAAGSSEAINGSQLRNANIAIANLLGGGASVNAAGSIIAPAYRVNGGTYANVGAAFDAVDSSLGTINTRIGDVEGDVTQLINGSLGMVQQDAASRRITVAKDTDGDSVDFSNSAGSARVLSGVAAGVVDSDAANVGQLKGTAQSVADAIGGSATVNADGTLSAPAYVLDDGTGGTVTAGSVGDALGILDGRVSGNTTDITQLTTIVNDLAANGSIVSYDATSDTVLVGNSVAGSAADFTNADGEARRLSGVATGAADTDAANVGQLKGTAQSVADAIGGGSVVSADGTVSAPAYTLDDGSGTGGTVTVDNVGDALANLDGRTSTNSGNISNLTNVVNNLSIGGAGMVQQVGAGADLTVGAGTDGARVDFNGTNGPRRLGGVANAEADDEAITLAQLKAAGLVDPNTGAPLSALVYDDVSLARATLGGTNGTVIANLGNGLVAQGSMEAINGGQLWQLNADWESKWNALDGRVGIIEQGIADGSIGGGSGSGDDQPALIGRGTGDGSIIVGEGTEAAGNGSVAIGDGASAGGNNSVAIGAGSVAAGDNEVSMGAAGAERRVSNVAAGVAPTDAVNLQQMNDRFDAEREFTNGRIRALDKRIDRMGAISAAYAGMAMNVSGPGPDRRFGAGLGSQNGRTALAVGFQRVFGEEKQMSVSIGGAFSGSDQSISTGAGIKW